MTLHVTNISTDSNSYLYDKREAGVCRWSMELFKDECGSGFGRVVGVEGE